MKSFVILFLLSGFLPTVPARSPFGLASRADAEALWRKRPERFAKASRQGIAQGQNQTLTLVIKNVKNDVGNVAAALYHSEEEFMKKTWQSRSAPSQPGEMHFVFENVPAGDYAISVMHDANKNGEVDKNFMGVPKEGFGFSNDALGKFGPPAFKDAKFVIPDKNELVITLKYY